jgi:hypothetical protein
MPAPAHLGRGRQASVVVGAERHRNRAGPAGEFGLDVPPGVRVVEETGNAFADAAAVMPGAAGYAVRTAADVVGRTSGAVSAARSFVDDLRGRSRS